MGSTGREKYVFNVDVKEQDCSDERDGSEMVTFYTIWMGTPTHPRRYDAIAGMGVEEAQALLIQLASALGVAIP